MGCLGKGGGSKREKPIDTFRSRKCLGAQVEREAKLWMLDEGIMKGETEGLSIIWGLRGTRGEKRPDGYTSENRVKKGGEQQRRFGRRHRGADGPAAINHIALQEKKGKNPGKTARSLSFNHPEKTKKGGEREGWYDEEPRDYRQR